MQAPTWHILNSRYRPCDSADAGGDGDDDDDGEGGEDDTGESGSQLGLVSSYVPGTQIDFKYALGF